MEHPSREEHKSCTEEDPPSRVIVFVIQLLHATASRTIKRQPAITLQISMNRILCIRLSNLPRVSRRGPWEPTPKISKPTKRYKAALDDDFRAKIMKC